MCEWFTTKNTKVMRVVNFAHPGLLIGVRKFTFLPRKLSGTLLGKIHY